MNQYRQSVGDGQGSLVCYSPWGRNELDMTEQLNWTESAGKQNKCLTTLLYPEKTWFNINDADRDKCWGSSQQQTHIQSNFTERFLDWGSLTPPVEAQRWSKRQKAKKFNIFWTWIIFVFWLEPKIHEGRLGGIRLKDLWIQNTKILNSRWGQEEREIKTEKYGS